MARSFQNIELFRHLTVLENLMLGRHHRMSHALLPALLWFGPARRQEIAHRALVEEVIDLLELQAVRHQPVGSLAYGYAKRVELGRALCMQPAVLLLDEPMAGMNAEEKEAMARYVLDVNELAGVTRGADRARHGRGHGHLPRGSPCWTSAGSSPHGTPEQVRDDPAVIDAYLGGSRPG